MRAFYEDNEIKRSFYVKIDNITIDNKGYNVVKAATGKELLEEVIKFYNFNNSVKHNIQIWSNTKANTSAVRLDTMETIPEEYEFVYVRGVPNNK